MVIGHFHDGTLLPVTLSMLGFGIFANVMVHFIAGARPSEITANLHETRSTEAAG